MTAYQVSPGLSRLAETWDTYASTMEDAKGVVRLCVRCADCEGVISSVDGIEFSGPEQANAFHLLTVHGYRMDGKQYDDAGNQIGDADA